MTSLVRSCDTTAAGVSCVQTLLRNPPIRFDGKWLFEAGTHAGPTQPIAASWLSRGETKHALEGATMNISRWVRVCCPCISAYPACRNQTFPDSARLLA